MDDEPDEPLDDDTDEAGAADEFPYETDPFDDVDIRDEAPDEDARDDEDDREVDEDDEPEDDSDPEDREADDSDPDDIDDVDADEPTNEDEVDRPEAVTVRAAPRRVVEDHDDADDLPDDDEDASERPTLRERLGEIMGGIRGGMIAAVAAGVLLLAGILLGTTYFMSRPDAPQQTAAAPEPPAPQAKPSGQPAPPAATKPPTEPERPATEAAQPPAAIPSGGLALETLSLFDGRDPSVFQSSPGNPIRFEGDTQGGFARIASSTNGAGSRITVGRGVYERLAGRTVRIVVVARAAATDPAGSLRFSYQNGRSLSPWFDGALGTDYAPLSLTWNVPKERGGPEVDAIMIEPGIPGDGTAADVSSVRIEILK